jgi:hypothetical protein
MAAALIGAGGSLLGGTSSLIGGGKQASAAKEAASIQADAARFAAQLQQQRFEEVKGLLMPFVDYGKGAMPSLQTLTGTAPGMDPTAPLTAPLTKLPEQWSPTTENLRKMPGYEFQLQEGQKAGEGVLAASGLGRSGAAVKAAENWASGLAASNWQSNWQQFLGQQNLNMAGQAQTYNQLAGELQTGLSAAGAVGGVGIQSAGQVGNALQAAAAAQASGVVGASNALYGPQGGFTQFGQSLSNAAMLASKADFATGNTSASPFGDANTFGGDPETGVQASFA